MFKRADTNSDSMLSFDEFVEFVKKCYQMLVEDGDFDERMIQVRTRVG
jgi:hypothetical protein